MRSFNFDHVFKSDSFSALFIASPTFVGSSSKAVIRGFVIAILPLRIEARGPPVPCNARRPRYGQDDARNARPSTRALLRS